MDWTDGYHTDIAYTHGYYNELNPGFMRFLMLVAGFIPPEISTAFELGYGQGISLNIHAATQDIAWTGTDFNPTQAAFASDLAKVSGANCLADSFQDLLGRENLPDFDFIGLHGVWSWISRENQQAITRFVDKKLRVGGVLYISYNANPGWAPFKPVRDLMLATTELMPGEDAQSQARRAFAFMEKFWEIKPAYAAANPQIEKRLEIFKNKDATYLVHEFFNGIWEPTSFAEIAVALGNARMSYACSAQPLLVSPGLGLTPEQVKFLNDVTDPLLRESLYDFIRNTQFRKDYWIKGPRRMGKLARTSALRAEQIILLTQPEKVLAQFRTNIGPVKLNPSMHELLLSVLGDGNPHSLGELEQAALAREAGTAPEAKCENLETIAIAVCSLLAGNFCAVVHTPTPATDKIRAASSRLNIMLEGLALQDTRVSFLASPITGGGIQSSRFEMLSLLAMRQGADTTDAIAAFVRDCLLAVGETVMQDGKKITEPDALFAYMREQTAKFVAERLPVLKKLQAA